MPRVALMAVVAVCLVVSSAGAAAASTTDRSARSIAQQAPTVEHRRTSRLTMETVSRTYDAGSGSWTVVVETDLSSNRLCLPVVVNCIVEPGSNPSGATLTDVQCLSPWWGHLGIFTRSCLRGFGFAGHHQRFRYTYVTDPAAAPTELALSSVFGRGVFPIMLERLATADLVVSLDAALDLRQDCPTDTVLAGSSFTCEITIDYPTAAVPGVPVTVATLDQTLTGSTPSTITGLTTTSPDWSCSGASCTLSGSMDPSDAAVFVAEAVADASVTGGELTSSALLTYGTPSQQRSSDDPIAVAGSGDTDLTITKASDQATARPGERISWTVTVTNSGVAGSVALPADEVVLGDVAPEAVTGLTVSFVSGVGEWSCSGVVCSAATMPPGVATFTVQGVLSANVAAGTEVVNEVDVTWTNDVDGPDFPRVAGDVVEVLAATVTPTTVPAAPSSLAFTG